MEINGGSSAEGHQDGQDWSTLIYEEKLSSITPEKGTAEGVQTAAPSNYEKGIKMTEPGNSMSLLSYNLVIGLCPSPVSLEHISFPTAGGKTPTFISFYRKPCHSSNAVVKCLEDDTRIVIQNSTSKRKKTEYCISLEI